MEFRADGLLSVRILSAFRFRYVYGSEVASLRTSDDEIVSEGEISFNDTSFYEYNMRRCLTQYCYYIQGNVYQ